jgi:glycosyltransferase involved in cell wall biosynthesis
MLCHYVYNISDKIIVLSPGFKKLIVTRGIPKDKIYIIPNWAYEKSILLDNIQLDKSFPPKHMFKILYAGNVGIAQRLDTVLEAAEIITKLNTRVQFIILGDGVDLVRLKKKASHMDLPNVTFIPQVPMQEVGSYLARADVLLVSLKKDPLFEITIPSKTQAYMAAGKPILMSVSGDASDLVVLSQCGVVSKPEDPSDLAKAVLDLEAAGSAALDVMGLNGKNYYRDELSLQNGVQKFSSIFISLIEK